MPPRVLVVDDSALMRQMLSRLLGEAGLEVVGTARDGLDALEKVDRLAPDVVTLDVEMPRLDGLATLERLLAARPLPVVMCSSLTTAGAETTLRALELGAVDFVAKPSGGRLEEMGAELAAKVRAAATARVVPAAARPAPISPAPRVPAAVRREPSGRLIVVATSTGGPGALHALFAGLPGDLPAAVLVVQHMPAGFTASLAQRLDAAAPLAVREAAEGDRPAAGLALVAPGDRHLELDDAGLVRLVDGPREHGVRPAADRTIRSAVRALPGRVDLVVLTGMGSDGAAGAGAVKASGGRVIAEDRSTAVVWGMPGAVVAAGLADEVLPLPEIAARMVAMAAGLG